MKKSRRETAETRKRIVSAAAVAFRRDGLQPVALADIMSDAGLTHGGFYRHFDSKSELVSEALATDLLAEALIALRPAPASRNLEAVLATYLSPEHRDHPERGCFLAALGSELARSDLDARAAATRSFVEIVGALAGQLQASESSLTPEDARGRAMATFAAMVGAVTLARVVTDPELSNEILDQTRALLR